MFEINPGLSLWTLVVFLLFAFLLARYAWRPLINSLQDREKTIRDALDKAETARQEAEELSQQNRANLAKAEEEYQKIVRDARAMAEKLKEEIVAKGHQESQKTLEHAREEIQRDVEGAKKQLRQEVADLAIKAAEKILDETLDEKRQRKLVEEFLNKLPSN